MSNVTHIAGRRHQETIGAIRHMLARAERGEIGGVFFLVDDLIRGEQVEGCSGSYRADPGRLEQQLRTFLADLRARFDGFGT